MTEHSVPTLASVLNDIRTLSGSDLEQLVVQEIPSDLLPGTFLAGLAYSHRLVALRACLLTWIVTARTQVPRKHQLEAFLASYLGRDSLVSAGTGSGKTLIIVLNLLMDDPAKHYLSITISPLKRLQITQSHDFNTRYNIPTLCINEDTPRDPEFWNEYVHNLKTKTPGTAQHLIVTVEQLFKTPEGHMPHMGMLVRHRDFQRRLKRIHVDEAHFVHTAGLDRYGLKAFRRAWGFLDELKAQLPHSITWQALSATLPSHILQTVTSKLLRSDFAKIEITSNRPNTTYAVHQVVGSLDELRNYKCFLTQPFILQKQPRVLIFFDNMKLADQVSNYLDSLLPNELQGKGVVHHYHSGMSNEYLQFVHNSFTAPEGKCKILCATSGESVGVDFPDVKIVCTVGLPKDMVDCLQRAGRVVRRPGDTGLFLIFYEAWTHEISLDEYDAGNNDPDRPRSNLKDNSTLRERAAQSMVHLIQSNECIRRLFALYLGDTSPEANDYYDESCCDRHDDSFRVQDRLPGPLYVAEPIDPQQGTKRKKPKTYRPTKDRVELRNRIAKWLKDAATSTHFSEAMYDILSVEVREPLVRTPFSSIDSISKLTAFLGETPEWEQEWGESLFHVIEEYECQLSKDKISRKKSRLM